MTPRPASVTDNLALTRLLTEIAWRIDHGDASGVWELFTEDGEMCLDGKVLRGREAIRLWGAERPAMRSLHVHTNQRFTLTGDNTAEGACVLTVYLDMPGSADGAVPFAVGEETGHYVRTGDGWRFASRTTRVLFGGPKDSTEQRS
ncbi:nuclear transport factor 2 family protein [Streptomyces sp. NPDC026672]|uniref:nuclear transport factor 2 family protein n=1 Tax=unclassified Streptomyces TaxID=2593676 RepID=UPI0033E7B74C